MNIGSVDNSIGEMYIDAPEEANRPEEPALYAPPVLFKKPSSIQVAPSIRTHSVHYVSGTPQPVQNAIITPYGSVSVNNNTLGKRLNEVLIENESLKAKVLELEQENKALRKQNDKKDSVISSLEQKLLNAEVSNLTVAQNVPITRSTVKTPLFNVSSTSSHYNKQELKNSKKNLKNLVTSF